ncbi:mitochondrial carrier domain-containing protein [Mucor lusitanicus]|uniref:Mitochondrial carrier domain-containing protein n=1 Tax=Mucor circinelloides f. lusitanicus TaxID=29924 RepID=A0A8H4BM82_MUCCL|nr:mitochondrial carrier domain-containing protein [Mucor lusitanicus]
MTTAKVNPHRPYYTPGLHHHNYTSLPSNDSIPLLLLEEPDHAQFKSLTTRCTSFALLKYFVTMLTSPFEVGTTLLQVQYSPHQDVEVFGLPQLDSSSRLSSSIHQFDADSDSEDDGFYRRPEDRTSIDTIRIRTDSNSLSSVSVFDDKNRPIYQMAPMEGGGVLEILSSIVKQPTEGWKSLFKESSLNDLFGLYDDTIPLLHLDNVTPNITTLLASHLVVGVLLSPLEIVRTRLVVQSASPLCSKYNGPLHALRTMFSEEGGIRGVYLSKNLLPTLFYHLITPLISCSTPLLIARMLRISAADSPILYGAAELTLSTVGLLILLPLETIRKRLHCQVPGDFKSTVAIRPQPYRGVLDALYKIMKEEGTRHKRSEKATTHHNKHAKHWMEDQGSSDSDADLFPQRQANNNVKTVTSAWGIRGLYRGFSMQLAANVMLFVFQTVNGLDGRE